MYKKNPLHQSTITRVILEEGETIEQKVRRILENNEPILDGAEAIFTERKDGVLPEYNPRTDKWDIAIGAMDSVTGSKMAQRASGMTVVKGEENDQNNGKNDGGAESIEGTSN